VFFFLYSRWNSSNNLSTFYRATSSITSYTGDWKGKSGPQLSFRHLSTFFNIFQHLMFFCWDLLCPSPTSALDSDETCSSLPWDLERMSCNRGEALTGQLIPSHFPVRTRSYSRVWHHVSYGFLWFLMVSYGFLWFLMVSYGFLWFLMVSYGFLWFLMVSYGF